jgi:nitroimidazol reductase NimA-like FMN-containing flavoprotein (pyridoxamine 5'-phosphate oxidase superfamily)
MATIEQYAAYLDASKIPLRLSALNEEDWPIVLSLWYLYEDGLLYCATPETAQIVGYLRRKPACGFEVAADQPPYCGVRGRALASLDRSRGAELLDRLLVRYVGGLENDLARALLARSVAEMAVCLKPLTVSAWNFRERMAGSAGGEQKVCPD